MVRFTSYNLLSDLLKPVLTKYGAPGTTSVVAGAVAGVITVYATMPFDNLKTKLQAVDGRQAYSGSLDCARKVVTAEGLAALWKGTTPRLVRLSVSSFSFCVGGID